MKESPKTQPRLTDPHSVSNALDAETSARIIERLEIRGKDLVFRELFQCFFEHLYGCEHVLEIGCGTGVVLRSLIKDPLFKGRVTGLDLSAAFIGAANRLAAEEGLQVERISFA